MLSHDWCQESERQLSKVMLIEGQNSQPQNTGTAADKRKRMETAEEL